MNRLLTRYLLDFNRPRYGWWDQESPGPWSTLMVVVAALLLVGVFLSR